jgi:hypothetical protein
MVNSVKSVPNNLLRVTSSHSYCMRLGILLSPKVLRTLQHRKCFMVMWILTGNTVVTGWAGPGWETCCTVARCRLPPQYLQTPIRAAAYSFSWTDNPSWYPIHTNYEIQKCCQANWNSNKMMANKSCAITLRKYLQIRDLGGNTSASSSPILPTNSPVKRLQCCCVQTAFAQNDRIVHKYATIVFIICQHAHEKNKQHMGFTTL